MVTGDAMFCQRDLSRQVVDAGGHYLWFVKDNQLTLLRDIEAVAPSAPPLASILSLWWNCRHYWIRFCATKRTQFSAHA